MSCGPTRVQSDPEHASEDVSEEDDVPRELGLLIVSEMETLCSRFVRCRITLVVIPIGLFL